VVNSQIHVKAGVDYTHAAPKRHVVLFLALKAKIARARRDDATVELRLTHLPIHLQGQGRFKVDYSL
jgi:hypothetical protein